MDNIQTIQFLIEKYRPEEDILSSINSILTTPVTSTNFDVPDSVGFMQLNEYSEGFSQSALLSFPVSVLVKIDEEDLVKKLANSLNARVLLQPDGDDEENPWALASPNSPVLEKVYVDFLDGGVDIRKD